MNNPNNRPRVLAAVLLAAALVVGLLGGVALDRWLLLPRGAIAAEATGPQPTERPGPPGGFRLGPQGPGDRYIEHMTRELGLTDEQRTRIEEILQNQQEAVLEITKETRPQLRALAQETREAIHAVLTPEQREQLSQLRIRRDRHQGDSRPRPREGAER